MSTQLKYSQLRKQAMETRTDSTEISLNSKTFPFVLLSPAFSGVPLSACLGKEHLERPNRRQHSDGMFGIDR